MNQPSLFNQKPDLIDMLHFEKVAASKGYQTIAGIDEAGRGPLAGPVVAAAVILPFEVELPGVNDSKKLSAARRKILFELIIEKSISVGIGIADHTVVDSINILQATRRAMLDALHQLSVTPDLLLIDGITTIASSLPQQTIKKGDSLSLSIAAASIIAKVTRDRMMIDYDRIYPEYGFAKHKGYGSATHLAAIRKFGPSEIHRKTFGGVKEHLQPVIETTSS